jgi:hypothetical protein
MIYDTPLAGARVRQPIRVTHSGEEGLIMQWSQLRSVFFTCFNEGTHRKTGVSDRWCMVWGPNNWCPASSSQAEHPAAAALRTHGGDGEARGGAHGVGGPPRRA